MNLTLWDDYLALHRAGKLGKLFANVEGLRLAPPDVDPLQSYQHSEPITVAQLLLLVEYWRPTTQPRVTFKELVDNGWVAQYVKQLQETVH